MNQPNKIRQLINWIWEGDKEAYQILKESWKVLKS